MLDQKCVRLEDQAIFGLHDLGSNFSINALYIVLSTQINF